MANPFAGLFARTPGGADVPPPPAPQPDVDREIGSTGVVNVQGFLKELEYNRELIGKQGLETWDRMARSDASVREALWHIEMPIRNATWRCEPASDDPEDLELCAFWESTLHEWLGGEPNDREYKAGVAATGGGFQMALGQILSCLRYGHSVFEVVEKVVDGDMEYEDPSSGEAVQFSKGLIRTWHKLGQRLPHTIHRWHQTNGDLYAIQQRAWKNDEYIVTDIPGENLLVFTLNREGDDFTGESILRPAYKAWKLKELVEKIAGVSAERFGVGIPVAYPDENGRQDKAVQDELALILKNLRAGAFSYVVMPGPKVQSGRDGFLLEILSPPGGIPDFDPFLAYLRAEIASTVCAKFSQLGHGSVGARATGDTQSKIWEDSLHVLARFVASVLEQGLRRLSLKNFDPPRRWPQIKVEDIEADNLEAFASAQSQLVAAGAIIPDKEYRQHVRQTIDAPRESDDTTGPADIGYEIEQGVLVGPDGMPMPATDTATSVGGDRADADAKRQQDTTEHDVKTQAKYAPKPAPPASKPPPKK